MIPTSPTPPTDPAPHRPAAIQAWGMFTILPAPASGAPTGRDPRRIIASLPWVGLALGVLAGLVAAGATALDASGLLVAVLGLAVLAGATGGLHLDGVADTADGLASRHDPAAALAVMKKHDIGPMGVATLVFVLLVDAAGLAQVDTHLRVAAVVIAPMVARLSVVEASGRWVPGARPDGFGALFTGVTAPLAYVLDAVAVLAVGAGAGWVVGGWHIGLSVGVATLVAWLVAWGWRRHLVRRLGGLTGDTFGSLVEISQAMFLLALALLTAR